MAVPRGNTTPDSREAGGELLPQSLTSSKLIPSGFHRAASTPAVVAPSFKSAFNPEADSPHQLGHLGCFHTAPSITIPIPALSSSIFSPQDSPTLSALSSSTFNDTTLPISSPPSVSSISDFFRTQVPNHQRRQDNLVRGTQGWVSQAASQDLPEIVVHNICIAHYVQLREQSKDLTLSSGEGRRTAAFKATAKELSLQRNEVRKGWQNGVNYLLLARIGGPGSLLLIGKRVRTLWEKDMLSEDVPRLLEFRKKHMPYLDVQARKLNNPAIKIISRYIAAKSWKGISLMTCLTERLNSGLLEDGEAHPRLTPVNPRELTAGLSSDHRKRRQSAQLDRPSKRSAHGSSEDLGLTRLLEAANHEECQNTFVDPFPQQVGGPEITTYMKTTGENVHLNTWMQDLAPLSVGEPDITAYMTTFNEGGQSNKWMQDLLPWTVDELDITTYMKTFIENGQMDTRMQELVLQPLEDPDLTTCMKPFEREGCLPSVQAPQQVQTVQHQMGLAQPTEEGMPYEGWIESH